LDLWFKSYEVFKNSNELWGCYQPLPMQQNLPKTTRICPETIISRNFEIPPKIEISAFFKNNKLQCVEGAPKHEYTIWIFNLRIFHMPFSMSKNSFCM
jgi:hypothetical protein